MKRTIPLVDLAKYRSGSSQDKKEFVEQLGKAFSEVGFVGVINHGVSAELVDTFYDEAKRFFALPVEDKRKYEVPGLAGQRGYTSFGKEHAKQSTVADLKEFYQIGQVVEDGDPIKAEYPENVYVRETPLFTGKGDQLYRAFEQSGGLLL